MMESYPLSRSLATTLIAALALGAAALAADPAVATPLAGAAAIELATPAASTSTEQVYFRRGFRGRGFGFRRGFGYRRPFGYRRGYGYGYRRGLPGHPIRRILRAL